MQILLKTSEKCLKCYNVNVECPYLQTKQWTNIVIFCSVQQCEIPSYKVNLQDTLIYC